LGERQPANTGPLNATYQLDGGAILRAQNILAGNGAANRVFEWIDGTLANFDPATDLTVGAGLTFMLAADGVHTLSVDAGRTGTLAAGLSGPGGFSKAGDGVAVLNGVNDFAGPTVVGAGRLLINGTFNGTGTVSVASGATLGGTGVIAGPVTVNGTLSPGIALGTLTISNALNLAGNLVIELDQNTSPSNDTVRVTGTLTNSGSGVVTLVNLGTNALTAGERFHVFNQPLLNGAALTVTSDGGVVWSNRLAVDGSLEVARVVNLNPAPLAATAANGQLVFSWPADHVGWRLLTQTNRLEQGLSLDLRDWGTVAGSLVTNHVFISLEDRPAGFYRLAYP
jgi:autotransporter-associated beta strand protein